MKRLSPWARQRAGERWPRRCGTSGVREDRSPGSNRHDVRRAGSAPTACPWCAIFASYCFDVRARASMLGRGHPRGAGARAGVGGRPTTRALAAWLQGDRALGRTEPRPGGLSDLPTGTAGSRTTSGSSIRRQAATTLRRTVEGNAGIRDDSNGGEVMRRQRSRAQASGFGRL